MEYICNDDKWVLVRSWKDMSTMCIQNIRYSERNARVTPKHAIFYRIISFLQGSINCKFSLCLSFDVLPRF